jgi:hypothetical protein
LLEKILRFAQNDNRFVILRCNVPKDYQILRFAQNDNRFVILRRNVPKDLTVFGIVGTRRAVSVCSRHESCTTVKTVPKNKTLL